MPGYGPWKIRLGANRDHPGLYYLEFMDPTVGGVQAGPFYLNFPTSEYAMSWLRNFAELDADALPAHLDSGMIIEGLGRPDVWAPMISTMFHSADKPHGLGSQWWYGSHPNWADVNPLLPPMTHAAEKILSIAQPAEDVPVEALMGPCLLVFEDDDSTEPRLLRQAGAIEYPDGDGAANYIVIVETITGAKKYFDVDGIINGFDERQSPFTFTTVSSGRITIRNPEEQDSATLSRLPIALPPTILKQLLAYRIREGEQPSKQSEWSEKFFAVASPSAGDGYGLYYRLTGPEMTHVAWVGGDGWSIGDAPYPQAPYATPRWIEEGHRLGIVAPFATGEDADDAALALSEFGEHVELREHSMQLLLERYQAGQNIDHVMLEIATWPAHSQICPEDLDEPAATTYRDLIDATPHIHAEADPASRALVSLGADDRVDADTLLSLYIYLYDGHNRDTRQQSR